MTTVENVSRRGLLRAASGAALLSALPGQTWAQTARVRSEVGSPAGQAQLEVYRRAVAFLRALPTTDRRRWDAIARGHRDSCPHGNWYLLPWHREYVRQLENIVRSLPIPGAAGFALPYWDWTRAPSLPAAFRAATLPDGAPNPLWTAERGARAKDGGTIPGELTHGCGGSTPSGPTPASAARRPPGRRTCRRSGSGPRASRARSRPRRTTACTTGSAAR
jgi:hypothetical protein